MKCHLNTRYLYSFAFPVTMVSCYQLRIKIITIRAFYLVEPLKLHRYEQCQIQDYRLKKKTQIPPYYFSKDSTTTVVVTSKEDFGKVLYRFTDWGWWRRGNLNWGGFASLSEASVFNP